MTSVAAGSSPEQAGNGASLDDRVWYTHGRWVAAEDESLTLCATVGQAAEIVRDHNALVAEIERLRGWAALVRVAARREYAAELLRMADALRASS